MFPVNKIFKTIIGSQLTAYYAAKSIVNKSVKFDLIGLFVVQIRLYEAQNLK